MLNQFRVGSLLAIGILLIAGVAPSIVAAADAPAPDAAVLAKQVKQIFQTNCYRCHGQNGAEEGKIAYITDLARLVDRKKIVPHDLKASKIFKKLISEDDPMPPVADNDNKPVTQRPTAAEIALVKQWIEAGAPSDTAPIVRTFISETDTINAIFADLGNVAERDRPFARYFTITHLYNAGLSDDELQTYRGGLSKLLNSLSWGRRIVKPIAADANRTLFRIDLRDYKWNEKTWKLLLDAYPYGVQQTSPYARGIYKVTECDLPYIRADWFVAVASRPPLYHDILGIPKSDAELEKLLQIDVAEDIRTERVARAGFNGSGVSQNNRLLERHDSTYGAYWKSYDFRAAQNDRKNLFAHPLGPGVDPTYFQQDGGEIIFSLPNGLQAYMLVNGKGERIDKGPIDVVSDESQRDRSVVNGVSCMKCHSNGMIEKQDQVRDAVLKNPAGFTAAVIDSVKGLYPPPASLDRMLAEDKDRFTHATDETGAARTGTEPVFNLAKRFEDDLDLKLAAAEAGMPAAEFGQLIGKSPTLASRLGILNVQAGVVSRAVFVGAFSDIVTESKLGTFFVPYKTGEVEAIDIGGGEKLEVVYIGRGEFNMGSPETELSFIGKHSPDEFQHHVKLTRGFQMGRFTVTQRQYQAVMGENPSNFKGDDLPVETVSWQDAVKFCEKLSASTGRKFRLPTEAEWEYACRAETTTPFNTGATISTDQANYDGRYTYGAGVKGIYRHKTTPVGSFAANPWGLYDMHGNVWQWCYDVFDEKYYENGAVADPVGPEQKPNSRRVLRGGSWDGDPDFCRSAHRATNSPDYRFNFIGFRVVLDSH